MQIDGHILKRAAKETVSLGERIPGEKGGNRQEFDDTKDFCHEEYEELIVPGFLCKVVLRIK